MTVYLKEFQKNPEKIYSYLDQLFGNKSSQEIDSLIEEIILFFNKHKISSDTKRGVLEWLGNYLIENLELKKALRIYVLLSQEFILDQHQKMIEKILTYKELEKFKYLKDYYPLKFEELIDLWQIAKENNLSIEAILMQQYKISKKTILEAIGRYFGVPALDLKRLILQGDVQKILDPLTIKLNFFKDILCIPFRYEGNIYLFCYYPQDFENIETVKKILQLDEVVIAFSFKEDIESAVEIYQSELIFEDLHQREITYEEPVDETLPVDSTIINLVNHIIEEAYKKRASDIHWESLTGRRGLMVRFRVDGECFPYKLIPESQKRACISRIKIMANLDIAEKRLPQDGKIKFKTKEGKIFELRVATIPTIENNEDVVMRILGGIELRSLEEIDLLPENYVRLKAILDLPYGLILSVGPTGSGKTTTLHAFLKYLNTPNKKIWTAEDPVEIVQDGLRQVQVNPKIGLTFAKILRAFLRADPDVIMIGETRDRETAHTLIEAALTGHLVLSTLHTNSASETVTRLLGMGIDPYNFADSLLVILAQRLAKRLCKHCKKPYTPSSEEIFRLKKEYGEHPTKPLTKQLLEEAIFYQPVGCDECNYTGFKGRIGIHELLIPDEEIKELIIKNTPAMEIRNLALTKGMLTLKQDGILKVLKGETTLKQILQVTIK